MSREPLLLAGLVVAGLGTRLVLALLQPVIEADGAFYGRLAQQVLTGEGAGGFHTVWPPLLPYGIAWVARCLHPLLPATLDGVARPEIVTGAARVLGSVLGALLVWPTHRIALRIAGPRVAWVAAFLVAFHPRLLEASTKVATEVPFAFLLVTSFWLAIEGRGRWVAPSLAGLAGGAAFLARPEGLLWLPFGLWASARGPGRIPVLRGVPFLVAFVLVVVPHVARVSFELDRVSIGAKGDYNLAVAYAGDFREVPFDWTVTRVTNLVGTEFRPEDGTDAFRPKPVPPFSLGRLVLEDPLRVSSHWIRNVPSAVGALPSLAYFPFALLGLGGLALRRRSRSPEETIWIVAWVAFVAIYALVFVQRRMLLFFLPLFLVEAAVGLVWLVDRFAEARRRRVLAVATAIVVVSGTLHATATMAGREQALEQKIAGTWLRSLHPPREGEEIVDRPGVLARKPFTAWYGLLPILALPEVSPDELARAARARNARYVLIAERVLLEERPDYRTLFERNELPPGLAVVRRWTEPGEAILYEVLPAPASGSSPRKAATASVNASF